MIVLVYLSMLLTFSLFLIIVLYFLLAPIRKAKLLAEEIVPTIDESELALKLGSLLIMFNSSFFLRRIIRKSNNYPIEENMNLINMYYYSSNVLLPSIENLKKNKQYIAEMFNMLTLIIIAAIACGFIFGFGWIILLSTIPPIFGLIFFFLEERRLLTQIEESLQAIDQRIVSILEERA